MSSSPFCHALHGEISMAKFLKLFTSKPFDLNDINRVVKMPFSETFQRFGPVAPNLHNIASHDVI